MTRFVSVSSSVKVSDQTQHLCKQQGTSCRPANHPLHSVGKYKLLVYDQALPLQRGFSTIAWRS
uniref:Uncharacterized protein n=1 Tax=Arundo donax TaxID=35708 RepID=A0A0A8ZUH2_ARUDO